MKQRLERALRYLLARLQESSTWRGLVLIATAAGLRVEPAQAEAIIFIGLLVAGAIAVVFPDRPDRP